jgi:hypothetical protein
MLIDCLHIKAVFPSAGCALTAEAPCQLHWDCHHGDTFILRVAGLTMTAIPQEAADSEIVIEISLSPREKFLPEAERFAAAQNLEISLFPTPPAVWTERATLSAAHAPATKQFIFSEESSLAARITGPLQYELAVRGPFKTRVAPSRDTDVIIHLERPSSAGLLSFLLAGVRD